jgi:hypothetical protein
MCLTLLSTQVSDPGCTSHKLLLIQCAQLSTVMAHIAISSIADPYKDPSCRCALVQCERQRHIASWGPPRRRRAQTTHSVPGSDIPGPRAFGPGPNRTPSRFQSHARLAQRLRRWPKRTFSAPSPRSSPRRLRRRGDHSLPSDLTSFPPHLNKIHLQGQTPNKAGSQKKSLSCMGWMFWQLRRISNSSFRSVTAIVKTPADRVHLRTMEWFAPAALEYNAR